MRRPPPKDVLFKAADGPPGSLDWIWFSFSSSLGLPQARPAGARIAAAGQASARVPYTCARGRRWRIDRSLWKRWQSHVHSRRGRGTRQAVREAVAGTSIGLKLRRGAVSPHLDWHEGRRGARVRGGSPAWAHSEGRFILGSQWRGNLGRSGHFDWHEGDARCIESAFRLA